MIHGRIVLQQWKKMFYDMNYIRIITLLLLIENANSLNNSTAWKFCDLIRFTNIFIIGQ